MGQFGNKFRKAREARKLSLDDVSNVTKISARMLQAIEEEHFDLLPGGVFNKGFIRAYAKHLGLNDEEAVNDYLACLRQAQIDAAESREPAHAAPAVSSRKAPASAPATYVKPELKKQAQVEVADKDEELPHLQLPRAEHVRKPPREFLVSENSFPWKPVIALAVLVIIAAVLWTRHTRNRAPVSARTQTTTQPVAAAATSPAATPQLTPATTPAKSPANVPASSTAASQPVPASQPKTPPATSRTTQPAEDDSAHDTTVTRPASAAQPAAKPAKAAPKMTLVIRATETSWISVTADGQLVSQETLIAPAYVTIHAAQQITARVGNAAGISFVWNGQEIPAEGAESQVRTVTFDQSGMKPAAPQSAPGIP